MSLVRPELAAAFARWREVLTGLAVAAAGLWLVTLGGLFFDTVGALTVIVGAALAYVGWRRLRFHRDAAGPGIVEVTEGQISYFSADGGGFAARTEVTEISLSFNAAGRPQWQIRQSGAPPLTIPVAAAGADALFDAFVALPGADPARILAALDRRAGDGPITVWRRSVRPALT